MADLIKDIALRARFRRESLGPAKYVRLEEKADRGLEALKDETGVDVAELVRIAVDRMLEEHPTIFPFPSPKAVGARSLPKITRAPEAEVPA